MLLRTVWVCGPNSLHAPPGGGEEGVQSPFFPVNSDIAPAKMRLAGQKAFSWEKNLESPRVKVKVYHSASNLNSLSGSYVSKLLFNLIVFQTE